MSHYIDDAAEGSGSEADHEDDYDSNAEEDGDETHGGFINDASSESGAEDEPGVRPRLSDEEMSDGEDVRQYVAQLRREKRAHSNLSGGQGGDGGAAGNRGKRKIVDDSDDDSGGADEGNRDKRKVRDDSDDDAGGAGEGNHGKRKIMNDSDDDSGGAGEGNRGKRKIMDDSDDDSGQGKGGTSRRGMESDSDDSAGHAERDADKGEEGTGKRKMAEDKNNKEHTDDDMQTDSGDEADAQTRRALAAHRVHDSTQPTLLVGAYDR